MSQKLQHSSESDEASSAARVSQQKPGLPVPIHPDDAKDKVFTAIMKALLKMGNKPSSPKELANVIIKYKYATLGYAQTTTTSNFDDIMSDTSTLSSEEDEEHPTSVRQHKSTPPATRRKRLQRMPRADTKHPDADSEEEYHHVAKRLRHHTTPSLPLSPVTVTSSSSASSSSLSPPDQQKNPANIIPPASPPILTGASEEESEAEYSDYYEEMLKGDENMLDTEVDHQRSSLTRRPSSNQPQLVDKQEQSSTSTPAMQSISYNGNQSTDQEMWTPYTFEQHDFDSMFLSDASTAHHIPFNIATPESISVSELDTYFNNGNGNSSSGSAARTSRKNFSSVIAASKDPSLLQKVLLANIARGAEAADTLSITSSSQDEETPKPAFPRRKSWPEQNLPSASFDSDRPTMSSLLPLSKQENTPSPSISQPSPHSSDKSNHTDCESNHAEQPTENTNTEIPMTDEELTKRKYHSGGHQFTIAKKTLGNIQCFELDSPHDIPDTKVLRFIKSVDGASEHVALRTRHADSKDRKNSQYFYLIEGYVNATQLRKAARPVLGKGSFDAAAETASGHVVVSITKGPLECRGAWVPLGRARELVEEFEIESSPGLAKLLSDDPLAENSDQSKDPTASDLGSDIIRTQPQVMAKNSDSQSTQPLELLPTATNTDAFVNFEEDDKKQDIKPMTNLVTNIDSVVTPVLTMSGTLLTPKSVPDPVSGPPSSAAEVLKSMNVQNLNLTALHQITATIPSLAHLSPTFDLAKSLAAYLQSVAKVNSSSTPSTPTSLALDLKSALSRFPALEALLKKDANPPAAAPPTPALTKTENPAASSPTQPNEGNQQVMIRTTVATDPFMYISVLDNIAVCIAVLPKTEHMAERRIMRRLDSGFINGTALLTAGGIETERERSMILSFEMERVRMANKASALFGTWIPLRRAQELAMTCSIQNRLGPFLNNSIEEYFPNPLPIQITAARKPRDTRITALALEAIRNSSDNSRLMTSSPRSLPTNTAAAQLQQLLLTHPHKALKIGDHKLKAPLLGYFDDVNDAASRRRREVVGSSAVANPKSDSGKQTLDTKAHDTPNELTHDESGDDTDSDTDVEEVRRQVKKMRDAAIDAMENASSAELEEMLSRAKNPVGQQSKKHSQFRAQAMRKQRQRRPSEEDAQYRNGRRRPTGGKWSGGKIMPSMIRKSATWNGAMSTPRNTIVIPAKKKVKKLKTTEEGNRVVEHKTSPMTAPINAQSLPTVQEDDEDEEIDIGGSDRDDDLR
ncbi:hypothetical protein DFQ28_006033 [Apophysomyces sp. BC1034]|nr:hypothetical protein DFQ29_004946 [Apophysomyces sp. BC1021]KAG0187652.1 hypothetical protein DFQ28_006033 [Apophysomyces sp. BC1034]